MELKYLNQMYCDYIEIETMEGQSLYIRKNSGYIEEYNITFYLSNEPKLIINSNNYLSNKVMIGRNCNTHTIFEHKSGSKIYSNSEILSCKFFNIRGY